MEFDGSNDITFTIKPEGTADNSFKNFDYVAVGGTKLTIGKEAEVYEGSTIVVLKADYLKTLSAGEYTVLVNFTDGSVTTKLKITAAATTTTPSAANVPATGEGQTTMIIGASLVCGAVVLAFVANTRKRKNEA